MLATTTSNQAAPTGFNSTAVLVTRPGEAPALQWIVDTSLHGDELTAFHQEEMGGLGSLVQHDPVKGAPHGFTELRVPLTDVPRQVLEQLPRRLQASILNTLARPA